MNDQTERWWLALPGQDPAGPYTREEIRRRVADAPGDWQVCADGSDRWQPWAAVDGPSTPPPPRSAPPRADENWTFGPSTSGVAPEADRGYLVLLHLSQFAGYVIPIAGIAVPLVMWLVKRDDPEIDRHGREVMNWLIFEIIAAVLCFLLLFVAIGIPLFIILGICGIVFPILGAVKASSGGFFRYPMLFRVL